MSIKNQVAKNLSSLQVNWHDFAFFDPVMYESLRQLIRHSQAGEAEAVFAAMDLAFAIDLCKEEGAGQVRDDTVMDPLYTSNCGSKHRGAGGGGLWSKKMENWTEVRGLVYSHLTWMNWDLKAGTSQDSSSESSQI